MSAEQPSPPTGSALIAAVRRGLAQRGDASKAGTMQAYMKSRMPFRGVTSQRQRELYRELFAAHPLADTTTWQAVVLELFRGAEYREERYAAVALTGHRLYRPWQTMATLPMYEEIVVTGAWWDLVDDVAAHRLRDLLTSHRDAMTKKMLAWCRCDHMWKRRSSIICQLGRKIDTDLELLYACIEPNLSHNDFFIRKAIGWALRDLAWKDPDEVRRYVKKHEDRLSGLGRREALKNLGSDLVIAADARVRR